MVVTRGALLLTAAVAVAACSGDAGDVDQAAGTADTASASSTATTIATQPTTAITATTTAPTPATTPSAGARDPACVAEVVSGDSLSLIASNADGVTLDSLREENGLGELHIIHPGDELDICIGNDVDDVTGASRLAPAPAAVKRQQEHLNTLFAPYRFNALAVDGDSGPFTRQRLCAARMGLGLRIHAGHMAEGSEEEAALFAADSLSIPDGAGTWANRWILIDKTCQVMFTGERDETLVNIFPTSTGEPGFETRPVEGVAAFRFDPALDNGGWHDSSKFPVGVDNPINGNMYKPIYFHRGQAIHGANNVPPEPRSKGCARLYPGHQDELIAWLGIDDIRQPTWNEGAIGVTVTVQGSYRRPG